MKVISVLKRGSKIWLRVGSDDWIDAGELHRLLDDEGSLEGSPLRGVAASLVGWDLFPKDPCRGQPECESRAFLAPGQEVCENSACEVDLLPAWLVEERDWLGRRGVARWLLENEDLLGGFGSGSQIDEAGLRARIGAAESQRRLDEVPRSSQLVSQSRLWTLARPWPREEHAYLPLPSSPEAPEAVEGSGGRSRIALLLPPENGNVARLEAAQPELRTTAGCLGRILREPTCPNDGEMKAPRCERIFVPRTREVLEGEGNYGFDWCWAPLGDAWIQDFSQNTTPEGCLCTHNTQPLFHARLANEHLEVRTSRNPKRVFSVELLRTGPLTFVDPGSGFYETLVAGNIFSWSAQGLRVFEQQAYPWISGLVQNVTIHQRPDSGDTACAGKRKNGEIFLPLDCPGFESFTAKGLCGDVVLHELSHEVLGSLVGLGTANRRRRFKHRVLDEALADFFALSLRPNGRESVYGLNCQNDYRVIRTGRGKQTAKAIASVLQKLGELSPVSKLATIASLYGDEGPTDFFHELVDFAKKAGITDTTKICSELKDQIGFCDAICKVPCSKLNRAEVRSGELVVEGTCVGTEGCALTLSSESGGERSTDIEGQGTFSARFSLAGTDAPLELRVTVNSPPEEQKESTEGSLYVEGYPLEVWAPSFDPGWLGTAVRADIGAAEKPPTWLVTVTGLGAVWSHDVFGKQEVRGPLELKLQPGFTTTSNSVHGWTFEGRPVSVRFEAEDPVGDWEVEVGFASVEPLPRRLPAGLEKPVILDSLANPASAEPSAGFGQPRLELLDFDSLSLTLGDWSPRTPEIRRLSWERPIDPDSLRIGRSLAGTVLSIEQRSPGYRRGERAFFYISASEGEPRLAAHHEWSVFGNDDPGIEVYWDVREGDTTVARSKSFELEGSLCRAPPYLSPIGSRMLVMTCDGAVAILDLGGAEPTLKRPTEMIGDQTVNLVLPGIVAPIPGLDPLQVGDLTSDKGLEWLVGPFSVRDSEDRVIYRYWVLDAEGRKVDLAFPMVTFGPVVGSPVVADLRAAGPEGDDDGLDEVAVISGGAVEIWQPRIKP